MAKKSMILRDVKRKALVAKYAKKRAELKANSRAPSGEVLGPRFACRNEFGMRND